MHPLEIFWNSNTLSLLSFRFLSHSDRILARFNLESFLIKIYLFMKNLPDFRETVETGVNPRLTKLY